MAGDWTAIEHATPRKSEIMDIALETGRSRHEVLGLMVEFWAWAETQTDDGHIEMPLRGLCHIIGADDDFWSAVVRAGWITLGDSKDGQTARSFDVPRADHWLSRGAKSRLSNSRRQASRRADVAQMSRSKRDKSATTEQNRTEQKDLTGLSLIRTEQGQPRNGRAARSEQNGESRKSVFEGLTDDDLRDTSRMAVWLRQQAVDASPVIPDPTRQDLIEVVAAAEHALRRGRCVLGLFATIVGRGNFDSVSKRAREAAKSRVEKYLIEKQKQGG